MNPKEWWINEHQAEYPCPHDTFVAIHGDKAARTGFIHVIEKSAYDDLKSEFTKYKISKSNIHNQTVKYYEAKLKIAVEALEKYANSSCDVEYGYVTEDKDTAIDALAKLTDQKSGADDGS